MPADVLGATVSGAGPRLVLVHGFTQSASSWTRLGRRLAAGHEVVAVDAPGHGTSSGARADLHAGAELLGRTGGRATYVGYSMGGRLCLHLALARPDLVERLVLVSATAGIDDDAERAARRAADLDLAASIERDGVDAFLQRWLAQPMFATLEPGDLGDRRVNVAAGLASSLRDAGTGTQDPLWARLGELAMPVLVVAGALDAKFVAAAERMAAAVGHADLAVIDGSGHAVPWERPDAFGDRLEAWLVATAGRAVRS